MKKITLLLIVLFCSIQFVLSQKVDSIKVEQSGDLIKIHYKILNSNSFQVFRVTVFASINGGLKSELKSLSGDFGESVTGGRLDYMVLWDVLKDVDEVKSVDFSVKAELTKDETPVSEKQAKKKGEKKGIHAMFIMDSKFLVYGPRLGYMKNWGITASTLQGSYISPVEIAANFNGEIFEVGKELGVPFSIYTFGLTKRLTDKNKFQLHCMAGLAFGGRAGDRYVELYNDYAKKCTGINMGLIMDFGLLSLSLEGTELFNLNKARTPDFIALGVGMRF
jgi:hypothetical protein